jgi:peptidoglycan/LPS O-acetylase OafA/YrhL
MKSGYVGVDIFFVISGFLITSIIIKGIENGVFSYRDFYARRIRRIFPSLIIIIFVTLILGWLILLPSEYDILRKQALAGSLFYVNLLQIKDVGYFEAPLSQNPLLHLWSLSVEEQFYVIWPILLTGIWRLPGKTGRRNNAIIGITALSFTLNIALISHYPQATFYLPFTRFWELGIGAILASISIQGDVTSRLFRLLRWQPDRRTLSSISNLISMLGIALIAASIVLLGDKQEGFPGWYALAPTIGAALIILAGAGAWPNRKILSNRIAVFFGLISYPLYLWHWVVLYWMGELDVDWIRYHLSWEINDLLWWRIQRSFIFGISIVLAWLTFVIVERRARAQRNVNRFAICLCMLCLLSIILPILFMRTGGDDGGRTQFIAQYDMNSPDYHSRISAAFRSDCNNLFAENGMVKVGDTTACTSTDNRPVVMLWGDSHAAHLRPGLDAALQRAAFGILQITYDACSPSTHESNHRGCNRSNELALRTMDHLKPDVLIVTQRHEPMDANWHQLLTSVFELGVKHVIIVGPVPMWKKDLKAIVAHYYWPIIPEYSKSNLRWGRFEIDKRLKSMLPDDSKLSYVSAMDFFCGEDGCLVRVGDAPYLTSFDSAHLTPEASKAFVEARVAPVIFNAVGN